MKRLIPLLLILLLLLSACGAPKQSSQEGEASLRIVATTYPIYLFASEVTKGVDGVTVTPLVNQQISCLHNYTLSVNDMKTLEGADLLLMNGAGLDAFLETIPLSQEETVVVNCSANIDPLYTTGYSHDEDAAHEGEVAEHAEDGEGTVDPHFWMDPTRAAVMVENITAALADFDPTHGDQYKENGAAAVTALQEGQAQMASRLENLLSRELITFHDGFSYFADAFDLTILMAVEEEEGQEASAQVIAEALQLIEGHGLPAIFTEEFSSDATATAIGAEGNVAIYPLSLIMSGDTENPSVETYLSKMDENISTILRALS